MQIKVIEPSGRIQVSLNLSFLSGENADLTKASSGIFLCHNFFIKFINNFPPPAEYKEYTFTLTIFFLPFVLSGILLKDNKQLTSTTIALFGTLARASWK